MFYPIHRWEKDSNFTYLGSEKNPKTNQPYDYWIYKSMADNDISFLARHGANLEDYGSIPICTAWYNTSSFDNSVDLLFGLDRARQLGLYYLVTNKRPLLEDQNIGF